MPLAGRTFVNINYYIKVYIGLYQNSACNIKLLGLMRNSL